MSRRRVLSVFSGAGGFDLALHRAGYQLVGLCEAAPYPRRVLRRHFPGVPIFPDVRDLAGTASQPSLFRPQIPAFDVLAGGPPCQAASTAGKRGGREDERWLWGEFLDLVEQHRPRLVLAENVTGLMTLNGGIEFGLILSRLHGLGYVVDWTHLPAGAVGAPHIRDRVFLAARPGPVVTATPWNGRGPRSGRWDGQLHRRPERWPKPEHIAGTRRRRWPWLPSGRGRMIPTPTAGDAKSAGSRNTDQSGAHPGVSLTDYVRQDGGRGRNPEGADARARGQEPGRGRLWPTPVASLQNYSEAPSEFLARRLATDTKGETRPQGLNLGVAARMWPTPTATDYKDSAGQDIDRDRGARGARLGIDARARTPGPGALAPEFAEWLMGWPIGWTEPAGPSLVDAPSLPWTNPEPPSVPRLTTTAEHRNDRLRCTGNGVVAPVGELIAALDWLA